MGSAFRARPAPRRTPPQGCRYPSTLRGRWLIRSSTTRTWGRRHLAEVRTLREVLAHQTVGVLVQAPFPGMVRGGEVEARTQRIRDLPVPRELLAVVRRAGMDPGPGSAPCAG